MANELKNKFICGTRFPTTRDKDKKPLPLKGSGQTNGRSSPDLESFQKLFHHPEAHYFLITCITLVGVKMTFFFSFEI